LHYYMYLHIKHTRKSVFNTTTLNTTHSTHSLPLATRRILNPWRRMYNTYLPICCRWHDVLLLLLLLLYKRRLLISSGFLYGNTSIVRIALPDIHSRTIIIMMHRGSLYVKRRRSSLKEQTPSSISGEI